MTTYSIGGIAQRSGFTASALRYYEGIGLVSPVERTAAGYRRYDASTLIRLAFIGRAKHLGCSLDEIIDLVAVWDGTCEPVQRRLHDLVTTKLAETQRQIDELTELQAQLRDAARQLAGPTSDGACDGECACIRATGPRDRRSPMTLIPLYDETAAIACTISEDEIPDRLELVERMRSSLSCLERTEHGLLLHFPVRPDIEADLRRFAVDEKRCCVFWGFDVRSGEDLTLRWDAPPSAAELVDRLESFFTGDEPASSLAGLL